MIALIVYFPTFTAARLPFASVSGELKGPHSQFPRILEPSPFYSQAPLIPCLRSLAFRTSVAEGIFQSKHWYLRHFGNSLRNFHWRFERTSAPMPSGKPTLTFKPDYQPCWASASASL